MVPHSSSIANSISDEKLKSADILSRDRQFLGKLARISRIRHFSLDASQKHRLHAMARLFGRQRQQFLCFNTNTCRRQQKDCQRCLVRMPQHQRFLTCAISKCAYNNVCITFERTSYSAAGAVNPVGYHARDCGTIQPEQLNHEPLLDYTSQAKTLIQQPFKCKQPPKPDGCLTPQPNPHHHFMRVKYR